MWIFQFWRPRLWQIISAVPEDQELSEDQADGKIQVIDTSQTRRGELQCLCNSRFSVLASTRWEDPTGFLWLQNVALSFEEADPVCLWAGRQPVDVGVYWRWNSHDVPVCQNGWAYGEHEHSSHWTPLICLSIRFWSHTRPALHWRTSHWQTRNFQLHQASQSSCQIREKGGFRKDWESRPFPGILETQTCSSLSTAVHAKPTTLSYYRTSLSTVLCRVWSRLLWAWHGAVHAADAQVCCTVGCHLNSKVWNSFLSPLEPILFVIRCVLIKFYWKILIFRGRPRSVNIGTFKAHINYCQTWVPWYCVS